MYVCVYVCVCTYVRISEWTYNPHYETVHRCTGLIFVCCLATTQKWLLQLPSHRLTLKVGCNARIGQVCG